MKDFKDLQVWRKAHTLTISIYQMPRPFPREELFGITSQLRRAGASISANIAEGCGRSGDGEFARFLYVAMGSASEVQYYLLLSKDLGLLPGAGHRKLDCAVSEVKRMLASLINKVNADRRALAEC